MTWMPADTSIVVVGSLCAVACALPGCFMVLRRMSMMGDAISHAVLPGLALGFLLTGSRASLPMFMGAAVMGLLTAYFTQSISKWGKVDRGAAMGITFTTMFALGLLLIVQATDHVDIDPGCVLYGALELTPFNTFGVIEMAGYIIDIPRSAMVLSIVLCMNLGVIILLFKEFKISAYDPELATTLGINAQLMHYLLMAMVAVTTVAAFESVGSIIVIAMLVVPAATAQLLTDNLKIMLVISAVVGVLAAVMGHISAIIVPPMLGFDGTSTSGMIAGSAGLLFMFVWLLAPRYGLLVKLFSSRKIEVPEVGISRDSACPK
ncbi:MAG TPA: iron ABC transporter [Verrucomicrobiales bacterium]|nr:iron ABC transporter [Verrucomicrobiales bacterium]HCI91024.1 iron ABC transporter [Verrucomicrobiales bacterium]HCL97747.1 iron ABC transporter [Verrucomicrobiales bacterium]